LSELYTTAPRFSNNLDIKVLPHPLPIKPVIPTVIRGAFLLFKNSII
jgi:hypothetical protein